MVYKILNMDYFLTQMHYSLQKALINLEPCGILFFNHERMHIIALENLKHHSLPLQSLEEFERHF